MSSLFRARRSDEPRSGGKLLRGRRVTPSASPYARPESSPAAAQMGSPKWLSGLISGAGKLISSVLPSYRSSESPHSSSPVYSSDDDEDLSSGDYEDVEDLQSLNQGGTELVSKCMDRLLAIVPKNETKLAIEQLLMQESFSRDECDKLTKLIQSRVVDFPSPEVCGDGREKLRSRTTGNDTISGALLYSARTLPERISYTSSKTNHFSPGQSIFEACTPDLCNQAVAEAKKWLEEKKLASKPKYDSECGPCTLNTDMRQYDIESEAGSPVDMAKSYMRSLPPWRSPAFSGIGFRTPPPYGIRRYQDEASYITSDYSLNLAKGSKRGRLFIDSWDTLDEARRVRLKPIDDKLECGLSKQAESPARVAEHERSPDNKDGAFRLADEKDTGTNHPFETTNGDTLNIVSEQEHNIGGVHPNHHTLPPEPIQHLDENQDVKQHSKVVEEVNNIPVRHDSHASASLLAEHEGNHSSEIKLAQAENKPCDADDAVNLNDVPNSTVQTSTGAEGKELSESSSQPNVSSIAETNSISDHKPQDGNSHALKKENGSANEFSANGSSAEANANQNHETVSSGSDKIIPQNGTRMKSIERMLTEPQATTTTTRRGKKVAVKSRRGRRT
ncbi:protein KAKU4 isoform X2 [Asparagus officinalis]|uniref:protein KAKU4 isoform X2 n=1 Tax=Asparagus officinalis TaxID=4686 RepID=UPI00098E095B|nr:protein KAKU4 isoform X2 [Asparagus officinalis]